MGKKKLALKYHKKALIIKTKYYSEIHPKLTNAYNNIGEVYFSIQNIEKARIYIEKGLDIRLKSLLNDHRALAISYSNLWSNI
jgi:tetratricopeptide (TPR) repeat protein